MLVNDAVVDVSCSYTRFHGPAVMLIKESRTCLSKRRQTQHGLLGSQESVQYVWAGLWLTLAKINPSSVRTWPGKKMADLGAVRSPTPYRLPREGSFTLGYLAWISASSVSEHSVRVSALHNVPVTGHHVAAQNSNRKWPDYVVSGALCAGNETTPYALRDNIAAWSERGWGRYVPCFGPRSYLCHVLSPEPYLARTRLLSNSFCNKQKAILSPLLRPQMLYPV